MPGYPVSKAQLDQTVGSNVVNLRDALNQARIIKSWLDLHSVDEELLTKPEEEGGFGYTADEAYALRVLYEGIVALDTTALAEKGKQFTGLL